MNSDHPGLESDLSRPITHSFFSMVVISMALVPLLMFAVSLLGQHHYYAELISNFRCQIMFLLMPFAVLLLVLRQWWLGLLFVGVTGWSMIGVAWIYLPSHQPLPGEHQLKIMSFNVFIANRSPDLALQRILEQDPDVVTVVEYSNHFPEYFARLNEKYPHQVLQPRWHGFGIAIFSKHRLKNVQIHDLGAGNADKMADCPLIEAELELADDPEHQLRLIALHVLSPTSPQRLSNRNQQLEKVGSIVQAKPDIATIVMGDFNCVPWAWSVDNLLCSTGLRDSRQGFGYQATWHRDLGFLKIPIDHFFVSSQIHVHDRYVAQPAGSDHLPVVIQISW